MDGGGRVVPEPRYSQLPYREADTFQRADGTEIPVLRPMLTVTLKNGPKRWRCRALVDTGAPQTLFDRGMGNALGVDFSRIGARREKHTLGGGEHLAQYETVELLASPFDDLHWEAEVGFFLDDWGMPFQGILGQDGFFDRWAVSFDYPKSFAIQERVAYRKRVPSPDALSDEEIGRIWEMQELGWRGPPTPPTGSRGAR